MMSETAADVAPGRDLAAVAALDRPGWTRCAPGARPEQLWVRLTDLRIDGAYQRSLGGRSLRLIAKMVANWDWRLVQAITVAELPGGLWELIDGQHRAVAALTHGDIHMLPATVLPPGNRADAARAFAKLNTDRVAVSAAQRHRAAVAGLDEVALRIDAAARAAGVTVLALPPTRGKFKPRDTIAAGSLNWIASTCDRDVLRQTLMVCAAANLALISAQQLRAVATLLEEDGLDALDLPALIAALRDWDGVLNSAHKFEGARPAARTAALRARCQRGQS